MILIDSIKKTLRNNRHRFPVFLYNLREYPSRLRHLLFRTHPLTPRSKNISPFFIIGCGRSGSTLLRSILTAHTKIAIPPESYVLQAVYRKFHLYRFMPWEDLVRMIVAVFQSHKEFYTWQIDLTPLYQTLFKLEKNKRSLAGILDEIYTYYSREKYPGAEIWGDKTPLNTLYLPWISKIFPRAKYIHIIRDGRDVVASYLKAGLIDNIEDACFRWNESIRIALKFSRSRSAAQYMDLSYEDMVNHPEEQIKRICGFLQVDYEAGMLERGKNTALGDVENLSHHGNVLKPISGESIGKWKTQFSPEEQKKVSRLLQRNLIRLRYLKE